MIRAGAEQRARGRDSEDTSLLTRCLAGESHLLTTDPRGLTVGSIRSRDTLLFFSLWLVWIKVQLPLSLVTFCFHFKQNGVWTARSEDEEETVVGVLKLRGRFSTTNRLLFFSTNSWSDIRTPSLVVHHSVY